MRYPDLAWLRSELRHAWGIRYRGVVLDAFIVGSEARGNARPDSDLDIAVVIPPRRGLTSLQFSEEWHFRQKLPLTWKGRTVDIQFFYPADTELDTYSKIALSKTRKRVKNLNEGE